LNFAGEDGQIKLLIPPEIILDNILEDRADIPINAIHMYSGLKADLYPLREGDALRQSAFQRRQQVDYGPPIGKVYIPSPEDLILYKLMYFGLSQQSKHSRDIAAMLKSKKNELDMRYIKQWAARFGLSSLWKEMLDNVS
jgi:hypothetical protein